MPGLLRSVDITELRGLCAAAELGSVGRAALRLGMSQPALSKRLQALEQLAGVELLTRSPRGVELTPAGRRLYEEARRLIEHAEAVESVLVNLQQAVAPLRLAASHSATDAFVAQTLSVQAPGAPPIELITANSQVVRGFVADGRVDLGVAASRPGGSPNPSVREVELAVDCVVCGVPRSHVWANRRRISQHEFLKTPMVVRDPASNARWTVDAELRRRGLEAAAPLAQAATPAAARSEALDRGVPVLLSRNVLRHFSHFVEVEVEGLEFRRRYMLVLPAVGEPSGDVRALIERLREAVADF